MEELELMRTPSRLVILTDWNGNPLVIDRYSVCFVKANGNNVNIGMAIYDKFYEFTVLGDVVSVAKQIDPDLEA